MVAANTSGGGGGVMARVGGLTRAGLTCLFSVTATLCRMDLAAAAAFAVRATAPMGAGVPAGADVVATCRRQLAETLRLIAAELDGAK